MRMLLQLVRFASLGQLELKEQRGIACLQPLGSAPVMREMGDFISIFLQQSAQKTGKLASCSQKVRLWQQNLPFF